MNEHDPERVKAVFSRASELPSAERESFLDEECGTDPALRRRVEKLLESLAEVGPFLAAPTENVGRGRPAHGAPMAFLVAGVGSSIGPYKLLQQIGEGGFGVVFMAEQEEPVRRRVALKVIKLGMDTRQVIARFEAERQALAMMEHPNIARVLDAGSTETGRPYFVMELVRGVGITEYCDEENLTTRERLELFMDVCRAVQHAHQKGVIHRDIKPSNVMITLHDGKPVPKVIDFGISKATNQRLTERTLFTEYGQFIGSPAYMSPEQAEMSGLDVDTRSDIYSLGVLLYELLTGTTPFDPRALRSAAFEEMKRMIREEDPPPPSTRLGTLGDALTDIAKHRRVAPAALTTSVRGDLDWIVMKALEKNRAQRYESASELAADIGRHFGSEPVLARPQSAAYRLRRFARRNRGPVAAVGAVVTTALLLGAVAFWQGRAAQRQAARVRAQSVLASASATEDPLLKALLLEEIAAVPGLPGRLAVAHEAASAPLPIRVLRGHEGPSRSAAFSPDGSRIVTGASDGIRIWRADGREEFRTMAGHDDWIRSAAFSPDGARVLSASDDRTARVWRVDGTGAPTELRGHTAWVMSADFSPDGDSVVTGSQDGTARVWPADGSYGPVVLTGHEAQVRCARFGPDGDRVVTASLDGSARIWRADGTGDPVVLRGHTGGVLGAAFSPDGTRVATAGSDGTVRLWSAGDGSPIASLRGHEGAVHDVRFSPDGTLLVTASDDGSARIWKPEASRATAAPVEWRFDVPQPDWAPADPLLEGMEAVRPLQVDDALRLPLTPDNRNPRTQRLLGSIYVELPDWDPEDWSHVEIRARASGPLGRLGLELNHTVEDSHDGVLPYFTYGDQTPLMTDGEARAYRISIDWPGMPRWEGPWTHLGIWFNAEEAATLEILSVRVIPRPRGEAGSVVLVGHQGPVYSAAFSRDGSLVVTASDDGTARVWPTNWDQSRRVLRGHQGWVRRVAYSPDGTRVLTASDDGTARIWRADGEGDPVVLRHEHALADASFSPGGKRVVTATRDIAMVWPADGIGRPVLLRGHRGRVRRAVFSPDGGKIATCSDDHTARVWSAAGAGEPLVLSGHEAKVIDVAFSPDGGLVATASADATTRVWQADGRGEPVVLEGVGEPLGVVFSPRGDLLATASEWDTARVWSVDGTGPPLVLDGHQDWVRSVAFSPDGSRVVTASDDGWVRIWRTDRQEAPLVLRGHENYVMRALFSPDGELVASVSLDGTARIWRADGTGEPAVLRGHGHGVVDAAFSPDGAHVATASRDGTARIWRVDCAALLEHLRASTEDCLTPEQRMQFLGETRSEALAAHAECERAFGRSVKVESAH